MRIGIVGAGIAGLAAAHEVVAHGHTPIVFDADTRVGGKLRTEAFAGVRIDTGPDSFLARRPEAVELCRELGLDAGLEPPTASAAFVFARGALRPLPAGLVLGVPTDPVALARSGILSAWGVARAALEPHVRGGPLVDDDALGAVIRRRFGNEVTDRLVDPLLGGINAGDVDALSIDVVAPQIAAAARRDRSLTRALRTAPTGPAADGPVFLTLPGGMAVLVDALTAEIEHLHRDDPVVAIESGRITSRSGVHDVEGIVLATPAYVSAPLLAPMAPTVAATLAGIDYSSVALILLAYPDAAATGTRLSESGALPASGYLVPRSEGLLMTAASWASNKWGHLAGGGQVLLRVSAGRHGDERALRLDDTTLVQRIRADLATTMDLHGEPLAAEVVRWPRAFPQYPPGHRTRMAATAVALAAACPTVALAGAALDGVGIPACIGSGRAAARTVLTGIL